MGTTENAIASAEFIISTMAKYKLHLPTGDFAFIEGEIEAETPQGATEAFKALKEAFTASGRVSEGLTDKELDLIIQNMCMGVTTKEGTELWAKATDAQKKEINRLSRALKRIKSKQVNDNAEQALSDTD